MPTLTEIFINSELPKRPYTNQFPLTAGHVPVATGVGLEVEARTLSASDISDLGSYATQGDLSNVLADANEYADGLVVGLWDDRGAYTVNAAGNINYPSSAGSGVAGALMKGDIFTVAGAVTGVSTINNIAVNNGDTVRALVDNPGTTNNTHWVIAENNIGYVPENTANKTTDTDLSGAAGTYPDTPTVKSYIDNYDISAASISSTGTVTLTRTESDLTFQVPTAISGLSFDANTGVLTSSYTNNAVDTTITVAANEVSDNVFRIKDDTDATKKIAFQASGIGTGQTKTISMPNFDVSLSPIRRRIQTSGTGLENLLLDNTETYIEITGGTTITVPVYPPYTVNAGASGYLFNVTNVAKTIRFQHTWSGEIPSFVGTCNHFFPETNETGGYTSTVPGSSGNTYTDIQLLPGETLRFVVSGTKTLFTVNIYRNSSNVMYENTFKIKRSALESYGVRFETSAVTGDRVITMPDADVDLGQMVKGVFTPVELLASSATQNLAPNYSYYLPASYAGALNLAMPTGAAIGTTFDISSIYSTGLDGTSGVNLTALNLTVPAGEYITGWGGAPNPINLLVSYLTDSTGYRTPNFTQGCTFRLTKTGATSWAIKPTFGSVLPKRFLVKNEGGAGGTIISTAVPAGTYRELTLPNADVNLGKVAQAATNTADGYLTSTDWNTFNNKLGLADVRYVFLNDSTTTQTTYTVPASAVTAVGRTIIELSNNSLTSITINAATGTGKSVGDSVNICITGAYAAQVLVASGVTLQGDLTFSYQHQTKTLVYKDTNTWKVVG